MATELEGGGVKFSPSIKNVGPVALSLRSRNRGPALQKYKGGGGGAKKLKPCRWGGGGTIHFEVVLTRELQVLATLMGEGGDVQKV